MGKITKYSCLLCLISVIHSIYYYNYFLAFLQLMILMSSILYHWDFKVKYIRYIDIVIVQIGFWIHLYYNFMYKLDTFPMVYWYILGSTFFIMGCIYNNYELHALLHICGVLGNMAYNISV